MSAQLKASFAAHTWALPPEPWFRLCSLAVPEALQSRHGCWPDDGVQFTPHTMTEITVSSRLSSQGRWRSRHGLRFLASPATISSITERPQCNHGKTSSPHEELRYEV